jgi:hypothetical protein
LFLIRRVCIHRHLTFENIPLGIEAFTVHDEFYVERQTADVQVHMVAFDRGVAYPMVWRNEGRDAWLTSRRAMTRKYGSLNLINSSGTSAGLVDRK